MRNCGCSFQKYSEQDRYSVCTAAVCHEHVEGCKYADECIEVNEVISKSGIPIAKATRRLSPGEWINSDNTKLVRNENRDIRIDDLGGDYSCEECDSFLGYINPYGGIATRKRVLIISAVSCVNQTVNRLVQFLDKQLMDLGDVEVLPLKHGSGCGHVANGVDVETLRRLIDGHIGNPNCFGAIVIGLGCEDVQYNLTHADDEKIIYSTNRQDFEQEKVEFHKIYKLLTERLRYIRLIERESFDVKNLVIGLQCGGSDGLSGVTANPLLGNISDIICAKGGTAILSETPELSGCREWCIERAVPKVRDRFAEIFKCWDSDFSDHEANPAPGNLKGGILNIFEKSLGAVLKGGRGRFNDVVSYGDPIKSSGLIFMDSPGYDPCSITGQVAAGANIIIFTTGRGSNYDNGLVPVLKVSSNQATFEKGKEYIDFDASGYVDVSKKNELIVRLMKQLVNVCSGELQSKSEVLGVEEVSFVPWQRGTTV